MREPSELRDYLLPFLDVDDPVVIRMRHEPAAASARLLVTLGAGWIVEPSAPRCVRACGEPECGLVSALPAGYELGVDGPFEMHRWCPECRDLVVAHEHKPECLWCGTPTVPAAEANTERSNPMAIAVTTCKHCTNEAADSRGIYAGLCTHHKELARAARANGHAGGGNASKSSDGYASRVRALLPAARALDRARTKLEAAGSKEKQRAAFQEASRAATAIPNEDNLARLEAATKELRKGAPRRQTAQVGHDATERTFKLELAAIARDFRA